MSYGVKWNDSVIMPQHIKELFRGQKRFVLVKRKTKKPIEYNWNTNLLKSDDPKLLNHLREGGNYGIATGAGLIVIDADRSEIVKACENLPDTFQDFSPGHKTTRRYYWCSLEKKIPLQIKELHFGEVLAHGQQVVGAGSIHPNGEKYIVYKNLPIAPLTIEILEEVLNPWIFKAQQIQRDEVKAIREAGQINIPILNVIDTAEFKSSGNEYYGEHPVHGSTTGQNFWVNPSKKYLALFQT